MLSYFTNSGSGCFGVSYNQHGILLKVDSNNDTDRIRLSPDEVNLLIELLVEKRDEFIADTTNEKGK
jgi:hypothetical protein